jgi:hypothetical protein
MNINVNGYTIRTGIPTVYTISGGTIFYPLNNPVGYIVLLCDCSNGGSITINLSLTSNNSDCYVIKKIDSSANVVTIEPNGSETIDGSSTATISVQYTSLTLVSDGASSWNII